LAENQAELEQSHSPAAVLVLANWAAQRTRREEQERLNWKLRLTRELYEKGFQREDILQLYRLIDWMMELRPELESRFRNEIIAFEEQKHMPYVTSIERLGIEHGRNEGIEHVRRETRGLIVQALQTRFSNVPSRAVEAIGQLNCSEDFTAALRLALTCRDMDEFLRSL
jgi:SOS response regulatory protein OraA/RecX